MGKVRHQPAGVDVVIREEYYGSATSRICYPGISSCAAITGASPGGLIGAHITIGADAAQVAEIFQGLKDLGAAHCMAFYVAGAFAQFKLHTIVAELNTRKKIGNKIRADLSAKAVVKFYDTTRIGAVHILAHRNGMVADFSWKKEAGNLVKGFTYPDFTGTAIPAQDFVVR